MMRNKFNMFVYKKVILVFSILIIPVYLLNFWVNTLGVSFIKQQYSDSNSNNLSFYSNQLNDELYFIRNLQLQFMIDSDLQKLGFMGNMLDYYERLTLVNSVIERLTTVRNSSDYVVSIGVYVKALNKVLSTKQHGLQELPNKEWSLLEPLLETAQKQAVYTIEDRLYFVEFSNQKSLVSYIELSVPKLQETLAHLVQYDSSGAVLATNELQARISSQFNEPMLQAIHDQRHFIINNEPGSFTAKLDGSSYQIAYHHVPSLDWKIITYVNQNEVTGSLNLYNRWIAALWIVSIIVIFIFALSINRMIHRPLNKLIRTFKMMEVDYPRPSVVRNEVSEFDYLYKGLNHMMDRLNKSIKENYEYKLALQNAELKQLQSQINPHFLYNSFYNIYRIVKSGEYEHVANLTQKLASYYQFITRSGTDSVPLDKEYRHARDYCDIQSIRFANRICIQADELPEDCKATMVPRLIIQPLIENAFEHGFEKSSRAGTISIAMKRSMGQLTIVIEDDSASMTDDVLEKLRQNLLYPALAEEKTGLLNVDRRMKLKLGEKSGIIVSRSKLGGMCAALIIPIQGENEHD